MAASLSNPGHKQIGTWALAVTTALAATLVMVEMLTLDSQFDWGTETGFHLIAIVVLSVATVTGLIPALQRLGWLLLWNAVGLELGLLAIGLGHVGAIYIAPLILTAFAISAWPARIQGNAGYVAAIGGACVIGLGYLGGQVWS